MTNNTLSLSGLLRSVSKLNYIALALLASSCANTSNVARETQPPAASAGDEPPPSTVASTPEKPARGRIVVQATCAGKPVEAQGHMPIERELVVDFKMGQEFTAEAGTRHITVTLPDDSVLIDKPTLQLDVDVAPDKLNKLDVSFPWARVQLDLLVRGTVQPSTPIKLVRHGAVVAEVKSGAPGFLVSPGNYDADVSVHGKTSRVKGLVFFEGTEQIVPVRVSNPSR